MSYNGSNVRRTGTSEASNCELKFEMRTKIRNDFFDTTNKT